MPQTMDRPEFIRIRKVLKAPRLLAKKSPPSTNPRGSGDDKPDQATQNESQMNVEITVMGDLDLDFADEDILTSTLAR